MMHPFRRLRKGASVPEEGIVSRMRSWEGELGAKDQSIKSKQPTGPATKLEVNGSLPIDLAKFEQAVLKATGSNVADVRAMSTGKVGGTSSDVRDPPKVAEAGQDQAADPNSNFANGALHSFLVAKADADGPEERQKKYSRRACLQSRRCLCVLVELSCQH